MPFCFKPPGTALSIAVIAAVTMTSPGRAQQPTGAEQPAPPQTTLPPGPGSGGPGPNGPGPAMSAPSYQGPPDHVASPPPPRRLGRGSAVVSANVNLRSGPGTDQELIATIPAGSSVRVSECSGEWCAVTWSGRSGYAIARNLNLGGPRQAGAYPAQPGYPGQPGYPAQSGYPAQPGYPAQSGYPADYPPGAYGPGYYGPPVVYGPAYYYGPRVYYGPGWGWRRHWW